MELPQSYDDALEIYTDRQRNSTLRRGIKLANNTYLTYPAFEDGLSTDQVPAWFGVRLHDTNVVEFHADGRILLNSGGWKTVTTKQRMNACLNEFKVYSQKRVWYVSPLDVGHEEVLPIPTECLDLQKIGNRRVFVDGFTIHPEGFWYSEEPYNVEE